MKKALISIAIILLTLSLFACKAKKETNVQGNSNNIKSKENINYTIDKILLSKSFQSIEPSVETTNNKNKIEVLISLGIVDSSGVNIDKVIKKDNDINIYVSAIKEDTDLQLAVPQISLELQKPKFSKFEDLKFNIVNSNYDPLKIKFGVNDVLSKIQSHFEISPCQAPVINLTKANDSILWSVSYENIIDREKPEKSLINLYASIDANSGDIISSEKTLVSSPVDDGYVLDYASNNSLLYKKLIMNNDEKIKEQLWSYNLSTKEKEMLFSSPLKIHSAKYSSDLSNVSIIEASEETSQIYIVPREDKKAYKVSFEKIFNPMLMEWKDDNNLFLIESSDGKSLVHYYDVQESISNEIALVPKNIHSFKFKDNNVLIEEYLEDDFNKNLYLSRDWQDFDLLDYGFSSKFIGTNNLAYLKKDEKLDTNSLFIYNLENKETINIINENISNFQVLSKDSIFYTNKNSENNNFTLSKYNLDKEETINLGMLINDKIYLDTKEDILYSNITLPFENINPEIIYSIELSNLK